MKANMYSLARLAQKMVSEGPHKVERTARRVRGLCCAKYVFDTIEAAHVWEHPRYPQYTNSSPHYYAQLKFSRYYVPTTAFTSDVKLDKGEAIDGTNGAAHFGRLTVGRKSTDRIVIFDTEALKNLVKVDFNAIDQWFEEEVPIYCHPKDPYKRIDILQSTRTVKVALNGITLAETSSPLLLLETTLRTRYYLPPTSVKWEYLSPSTTESLCPYKGQANYHHVNVDGQQYQNLVWYYRYPTMESAPVAGYLCFFNEGVDIWVDGVKEAR